MAHLPPPHLAGEGGAGEVPGSGAAAGVRVGSGHMAGSTLTPQPRTVDNDAAHDADFRRFTSILPSLLKFLPGVDGAPAPTTPTHATLDPPQTPLSTSGAGGFSSMWHDDARGGLEQHYGGGAAAAHLPAPPPAVPQPYPRVANTSAPHTASYHWAQRAAAPAPSLRRAAQAPGTRQGPPHHGWPRSGGWGHGSGQALPAPAGAGYPAVARGPPAAARMQWPAHAVDAPQYAQRGWQAPRQHVHRGLWQQQVVSARPPPPWQRGTRHAHQQAVQHHSAGYRAPAAQPTPARVHDGRCGLPASVWAAAQRAGVSRWRTLDTAQAVASIMQGHHVALQAPPATGKTTALVLATLGVVVQSLVTSPPLRTPSVALADVRAVIVVPLREVAMRLGALVHTWIARSSTSDTVRCCVLVSRHTSSASPTNSTSSGASASADAPSSGGSGNPARSAAPAAGLIRLTSDAGPGAGAGTGASSTQRGASAAAAHLSSAEGAPAAAVPAAREAAGTGHAPSPTTPAVHYWEDNHHCGQAVILVATPGKLSELHRTPEHLRHMKLLAVDAADVVIMRRAFVTQAAEFLAAATAAAAATPPPAGYQRHPPQRQGPALALATTTVPHANDAADVRNTQRRAVRTLRRWIHDQFGASRHTNSPQAASRVFACGNQALLGDVHSRRAYFVVPVTGADGAAADAPWWEEKLPDIVKWLLRVRRDMQSDSDEATCPQHQIMVFTANGFATEAARHCLATGLPDARVGAIRTRRCARKEEHLKDVDLTSDVWEQFLGGDLDVLVTSDVGSVGLDTTGVWAVVNVGTMGPHNDARYVHRAGRCGRVAGSRGCVVTLVDVTVAVEEVKPAGLTRRARRRRARRGTLVAQSGEEKVAALEALHQSFTPFGRGSAVRKASKANAGSGSSAAPSALFGASQLRLAEAATLGVRVMLPADAKPRAGSNTAAYRS